VAFNPIGESDYERWAIHEFFLRVTLPIVIAEGDQFGIIATATLFSIADKSFLITAGHILDTYEPGRWAFPTHPRKGTIHTIGAAEYVRPSEPELDICIIELKDPEVIRILRANWRFLTLDNVWLPDLSADAVLLAGYPSARAKFIDKDLHGKIFIVRQQFKDGVPAEASEASTSSWIIRTP
jgi:hypothetical protein